MSSLTIEHLVKTYRGFRLHIDTLSVEKGAFFTILGPSGSGKTTLLRLVAGLDAPDRGRLVIGGRDVAGIDPDKRRIGMVFQQARLFPHMNLRENVVFGLKMQGVGKSERRSRGAAMLDRVGLGGMGDKFPGQLSGGQQKRAAIARALLYQKELLLLDEPFNELDPNLRREMRRFVKKIHDEMGFTALLVTHDREEAYELSDRIAVMRAGRIVETGDRESLYRRPKTLYAAGFLGERNLFRYREDSGGILVGKAWLPVRGAAPSGWLMIPEGAVGFEKAPAPSGETLSLPAVLGKRALLREGAEVAYETDLGLLWTKRYGWDLPEAGDKGHVWIGCRSIRFLEEG